MPFHDYSSVSLRSKVNGQPPLRHSSPAFYDYTHDANTKSDVKNQALLGEAKVVNSAAGVRTDKNKESKTPLRSNSNPAYFEDYSKSKPESDKTELLADEENGILISGTEISIFLDTKRKKSPSGHRRYSSFNGTVISDGTNSKNSSASNGSAGTIPGPSPKIIVNKPPVPTNSAGSPVASVKLRSKPTSSPKGSRRRQGFVLDQQHSISSPVLISHEISAGETGIKLRDLDDQEQLLNRLQIEQPVKKAEKPPVVPQSETTSVGTRMAERIQRTIKALYTSNSSLKKSYSMQENLLTEIENEQSDGNASPEVKARSSHNQYLETSSPKSDKRNNRKRSPKPSQKNNLQVKDVDGSRRFKWRGSVNKIVKKFGTGQPFVLNGTFGVHLEDCPPSISNEFVPFIVELCCRIVQERGLHFIGIYRVPGNNAALSALQEDLNNHGAESIRPDDERLRDLNVVSSLLKSFFRKLPEPLFTNELYHDFIQANRQATPESRLNSLRKLVHMLPGPHYETLKFLISHLRLVADNCESNKMEVRNLAIVFGPTLVRNTAADNTATMVTDMSDQCRIIESIIDHCDFFFRGEHEEIPAFVRSFHL